MASQINLDLTLQKSLNRAMVFTAWPSGKPVYVTIYHHKKTSALTFDIDSRPAVIKNKEVTITMYRNLENCDFTKTFFRLENLKINNYDYQCKFGGVNKLYEHQLFPFSKEKLDLQAGNSNEPSKNYLLILGWKLFGLEDSLIFYYVQRRCYNKITKINCIRTAGLQFATPAGEEALVKYVDDAENSIRKETHLPSIFTED